MFCRNWVLRIGKGVAWHLKGKWAYGDENMLQLELNCLLPPCRKDILCKHSLSDHTIPVMSSLVVDFLQRRKIWYC